MLHLIKPQLWYVLRLYRDEHGNGVLGITVALMGLAAAMLSASNCALASTPESVNPGSNSAEGKPYSALTTLPHPLTCDTAEPSPAVNVETPDYPAAIWTPAAPGNYQRENRPTQDAINMVVIHDIEGATEDAVRWFQNPVAQVSAHYVVSSSTGQVYQMVKEHDVAWHAGNSSVNHHSIGIEHEGFAYRPGFYNPEEYETSAKLVRAITTRYNIPRDRAHIIGHAEVPNPRHPGLFGGANGHTDPGPYWDWDSFMTLVRNDSRLESQQIPAVIHPGEMQETAVTYTNTGDDPWPSSNNTEKKSLASRGLIYLGTWGPIEHVSPFFNYKSWTSPRLASAPVEGDTAGGAAGHFKFALLGPRTLGEVKEQFRLIKYPAAPGTPTGFGETITAVVRVEPWDLMQAASSPGFKAPGWNAGRGLWWRKTGLGLGTGAGAEWNVPLPISGSWDVYVRWAPGKARTRKAFYQVIDAGGTHTVAVDQRAGGSWRKPGDSWRKLGVYHFADHQPATVRLSANGAPGIVVAEGVRVVGPFMNQ